MIDNSEQFINTLQQHIGILIKISRAFAKNHHDQEDLINDITLQLWQSFGKFKGESKLTTWIYRVAINTAINFNKKLKRELSLQEEGIRELNWLTESEDLWSDESEKLYDSINTLGELNKIITLLHLDGNSYEEIATITGISASNVGTRLNRVREELKHKLNKR